MLILSVIIILIINFLLYKLIDSHTHDIEINREEIYNGKIQSEFKILHLSDLHFNFNRDYQQKLLKIVNSLEYDLILFTGDYLNKNQYLINLGQFLEKINNKGNAFAVYGNHDYEYNLDKLESIFKDNNIKILDNKGQVLDIKNNNINIIGVETPDLKKDDFKKATEGLNLNQNINIMLSHTYHIIKRENIEDINLVLAGDTHGGQINLPIINKIIKNNFDLKYKSGKYILNKLILLINKGIGTSILPFRINCKPEVLLITLAND
ncbi:MAG: metallophosphoesterase [Halanaerobiales bacterium]